MQETKAKIKPPMRDIVACREKIGIKDILDRYYFHYSGALTDELNFIEEFKQYGLNDAWAKPKIFHNKINRELRAYVYNEGTYDPIAVCLAVRIRIEELLYMHIRTEKKEELIDTHGTTNKLQFALQNGVCFPETFFLLGIIYNHPLHEISENMDKPLGMKLDNYTIKKMIRNLWS